MQVSVVPTLPVSFRFQRGIWTMMNPYVTVFTAVSQSGLSLRWQLLFWFSTEPTYQLGKNSRTGTQCRATKSPSDIL